MPGRRWLTAPLASLAGANIQFFRYPLITVRLVCLVPWARVRHPTALTVKAAALSSAVEGAPERNLRAGFGASSSKQAAVAVDDGADAGSRGWIRWRELAIRCPCDEEGPLSSEDGDMSDLAEQLPDVQTLLTQLDEVSYLADEALGTALFLAARMSQPILLEGEPGVGKTEAAKALAAALDTPLIRLQCYEGLTSAEALYEWNYPRQLLAIRLAEARGEAPREADLFSDDYLLERPLLAALDHPGPRPAVLLIDEVDRGDDEFEAFLFELLAESAVTIPELGTRRAAYPPVVVLTSNRTRDLHDALKRRCLYHWIDYPDAAQVAAIIRRRVPAASERLAAQVANGVHRLRGLDLAKPPGVAEAISWAQALQVLGAAELDADAARKTMGAVLKYAEDLQNVRATDFAAVVGHGSADG